MVSHAEARASAADSLVWVRDMVWMGSRVYSRAELELVAQL